MSNRRILGIVALILFLIAGAVTFNWVTIDTNLPLEEIATGITIITGVLLLGVGVLEAYAIWRSWQVPEPEDPPRSDRVIYPTPLDESDDEMDSAIQSVENAEEFVEQTKRRVLIDVEEIPED